MVIDADVIPVTDAALLPVWRSKLWIHNAAFDVKHLIAAGVDLNHAEIIDTMLLAGMVYRCDPNPNRPAPSRPSLAKYAKAAAGIDLPKSGQVSNWARPVLSRDQLNYAALDAAVLAFLIPGSWDRLPDETSAIDPRRNPSLLPRWGTRHKSSSYLWAIGRLDPFRQECLA